jgi:hypothetical protein
MTLRNGWMRCGTLASVLLLGAACAGQKPAGDVVQTGGPMDGDPNILSAEQCEEKGGQVVGDIGDGSVFRNGCPGSGTLLGNVRTGIEGGICCKG